jgi:endonuclease YncB( thermonuclease family)
MQPVEARAVRVIDGDTILVTVRVRTTSSAPEARTAAGDRATTALKKRFPKGKKLVMDIRFVDQWGRIIAAVREGGL